MKMQATRQTEASFIKEGKSAVVRTGRQKRLCIHDGTCEREATCRGLCTSHVQEAYRQIRDEAVTEEQLVRAGRMLAKKRPAKMFFLEAAS